MTPTLTVAWPLRRSGNQTLPGPPQFANAVVRSFVPAEAPLLQTYWLEPTLTPAVPEGAPVLPPGGVIPPRPDQYGTSECRYPASAHQVMYCLGIQWKVTVLSHIWALSP